MLFRQLAFAFRKRRYRTGASLSRFIAPDVKREVQIVDSTHLAEGYIVARLRTWNVLPSSKGASIPDFGPPERMPLDRLWQRNGPKWGGSFTDEENVHATFLKDRTIFLGSAIDDPTANDVIAKLLFLEMDSSRKPIQLYINSPGGLVLAGLAIMDTMDKIRAPISTCCIGIAHSMSAVILAYGHSGSRMAVTNAIITFTLPQAPGDADQQKVKDAVRLGDILVTKTAAAMKRPVAEVRGYFRDGTSFSAQDALAHGIIDHIVDAAR